MKASDKLSITLLSFMNPNTPREHMVAERPMFKNDRSRWIRVDRSLRVYIQTYQTTIESCWVTLHIISIISNLSCWWSCCTIKQHNEYIQKMTSRNTQFIFSIVPPARLVLRNLPRSTFCGSSQWRSTRCSKVHLLGSLRICWCTWCYPIWFAISPAHCYYFIKFSLSKISNNNNALVCFSWKKRSSIDIYVPVRTYPRDVDLVF